MTHLPRSPRSVDALQSLTNQLDRLDHDSSLDSPHRLRDRLDALDILEAHLIQSPPSADLLQRARDLQQRLESANTALFESIRAEILRGQPTPALLEFAPSCDRVGNTDLVPGESYDFLDELVSGVLRFDPPAAPSVELAREMVFYQPTPARHIFALIRRAGLTPHDVLIDLGSGLGHVPLLVSISTGARTIGIELEPAYIDRARRCAQSLLLNNVSFLQQDARSADLSAGTVFFLYTPFTGSILQEVLASLRRESSTRPLRVCTFGPCTATIAAQPWLSPIGPLTTGRIALFQSRP